MERAQVFEQKISGSSRAPRAANNYFEYLQVLLVYIHM